MITSAWMQYKEKETKMHCVKEQIMLPASINSYG